MFQALYQRFGNQLSPQKHHVDNTTVLPWPATYTQIMPIENKPYTLHLSGKIEVPQPKEKDPFLEGEVDVNTPPPPPKNYLTLSWDELLALPQVTQERRTVSAQGWTYKTSWQGVTLATLLEKITLKPEATWIKQTNLSGHVEYLPLNTALASQALLCYKTQEAFLPPLYGGPLWFMVFDRFNYKGLSQLSRLAFISEDQVQAGFWEQKGYSTEGAITPGNYYAFDLADHRPVQAEEEITQY